MYVHNYIHTCILDSCKSFYFDSCGILIVLERYNDERKHNIDDYEDISISTNTVVETKRKYFSCVLQLLVFVI